MSDATKPEPGMITWCDLTVKDAEKVRDFYAAVAGWKSSDVNMGDYNDFAMSTASGQTVAGVCHARGTNAKLPPQWMLYVTVADLDQSVSLCRQLGGEVLVGPKEMGGHGRYCVVRDPAGAAIALYQPAGS
jgi:predicted enzyme related to lactoylglutathione lyase